MINPEELDICKRRGHYTEASVQSGLGWVPCKWCGIWQRYVLEEREDEPPQSEQHPLLQARRDLATLNKLEP